MKMVTFLFPPPSWPNPLEDLEGRETFFGKKKSGNLYTVYLADLRFFTRPSKH